MNITAHSSVYWPREIGEAALSRGQYTLEWAVMFMAVVAALALMLTYVRDAMRAGVKSTEMQLNSAMQDNRPIH
jgi:uncharacterized protein (UPF0333 family)